MRHFVGDADRTTPGYEIGRRSCTARDIGPTTGAHRVCFVIRRRVVEVFSSVVFFCRVRSRTSDLPGPVLVDELDARWLQVKNVTYCNLKTKFGSFCNML